MEIETITGIFNDNYIVYGSISFKNFTANDIIVPIYLKLISFSFGSTLTELNQTDTNYTLKKGRFLKREFYEFQELKFKRETFIPNHLFIKAIYNAYKLDLFIHNDKPSEISIHISKILNPNEISSTRSFKRTIMFKKIKKVNRIINQTTKIEEMIKDINIIKESFREIKVVNWVIFTSILYLSTTLFFFIVQAHL